MMTTRFAALATALGIALGAITPTLAAAQANCDWYAKTAVRQQQINETNKCGFTGDEWHKELAVHMTWCQSVPPDLWKDAAKKRSEQLAVCEKK